MPSPFQQQSRLRKLTYTVLIVALFTAALFLRRDQTYGVEAQANNLEIQEHNLGEVELTGSALRLGLTGLRGLVICTLWSGAIEKQKKHEWNDLEVLTRSVTKLQPHFITPWLFQSWNLAYNVSVESDRVRDKYFYMTRGIELLAEGERQNKNHPDLRFTIGFYNQHKIGLADEANTLRSLFQMSCIPPAERDPNSLRTRNESGRLVVDLDRFQQFCQAQPMLVRRLRESLRLESPEEIVDFLAANQKIPGRYEETPTLSVGATTSATLKPAVQQFPILPPKFGDREEFGPDDDLPYEFDNFTAARAWFGYAMLPLPPADPKPRMLPPPYDKTKYRMPRYMASQIFRGYPARGQTFVAERLEKEGWFDREGWLITRWFPDDRFRVGGSLQPAVVGSGRDWAVREWAKAHEMWRDHGIRAGLYLTPEQLKNLDDQAELYRRTFNMQLGQPTVEVPAEQRTPQMVASADAYDQLHWYERNRDMTNFPHFYFLSQVEMEPDAVQARKAFFLADQFRRAGERDEALRQYNAGLPLWRDLMKAHRDFRRDSIVQEDTYEVEMNYLNLVESLIKTTSLGRDLKWLLVVQDSLAQAAVRPPAAPLWLPPAPLAPSFHPTVSSPLDVLGDDGEPLISAAAKFRVRSRLGIQEPTPEPETSAPAPMP